MRVRRAPPARVGSACLFQVIGLAGSAAACALAFWLARSRGLSSLFVAILIALTIPAQTALTMVVKVALTGRERLVFYHHAALLLITTIAAARVADEPVGAWLDLTTPPLFLFLAFGRIGCWTAGCCYGRPSRFGFAYGETHDDVARGLIGLPLCPVQLGDSAAALSAALLGVWGAPFHTCFATYAAARFPLEYLRGEPGRWRMLGLTEAQWTSAVLLLVEWPLSAFPLALTALVWRPLPPEHIVQLAQAVACTRIERAVATTSFGVRLKREGDALRVLTSAEPGVIRYVKALDRLLCANRSS
jgi:hypothetical protein